MKFCVCRIYVAIIEISTQAWIHNSYRFLDKTVVLMIYVVAFGTHSQSDHLRNGAKSRPWSCKRRPHVCRQGVYQLLMDRFIGSIARRDPDTWEIEIQCYSTHRNET